MDHAPDSPTDLIEALAIHLDEVTAIIGALLDAGAIDPERASIAADALDLLDRVTPAVAL